MSLRILTMSELNQRAKNVLIRELGVGDTIRFLNQFRQGE